MYSKETNLHSKKKTIIFCCINKEFVLYVSKNFFGNSEYNYWSSVIKYLFCSNHWLSKSNLRHHRGVEI